METTASRQRFLQPRVTNGVLVAAAVLLLPAAAAAQDELPPGLPSGPPPAPDLTGRYAPLTCAPSG